MMSWDDLLSYLRLGQEQQSLARRSASRTNFQVDYDRIIFSPAFRRLQNKTQVFPLPESDFVRNRLTHSLETASVGRSLGNLVGELVLQNNQSLRLKYNFSDFGSLVSAACLAHDIGNPPFGHAGEEAISSYFKSDSAQVFLSGLTPNQLSDLQSFEGNAAGFRILAHTPASNSGFSGGLGLSYATYATFVKYPRTSFPDMGNTGKAILKKYSFFDSEKDVYYKIAKTLGIDGAQADGKLYHFRHPLAYLVEAADDICYSIIDYEDGFQIGYIEFDEIESLYIEIIGKELLDKSKYNKIYNKSTKIAYLRSKAINALIQESAHCFIKNEKAILSGSFDACLLELIPQNELIRQIKHQSFDKIYNADTILKIEAAGYKVLPGLLDIYINAVFNDGNKFNSRLQKLIPDEYMDIGHRAFEDAYTNLLNITMYIASMTDQHAIRLYRDFNGISLAAY